MKRATHLWILVVLGLLVLTACGGDTDRRVYNPPAGGQGPKGGAAGASSNSSPMGGARSGGAPSTSTVTGTGAAGGGANGGTSNSTVGRLNGGTASTGGAIATGGASSLGGTRTTGGNYSTGGINSTGGIQPTGGADSTGGTNTTGGTISTGGRVAAGGSNVTGGAVPTGGGVAAGGISNTGGTSNTGGSGAVGTGCGSVPLNHCVTALAVGDGYNCALVNGGAWCWGDNLFGELGNNTRQNSLVPVQVPSLTAGVSAIAAMSSSHTCALINGAAWCWGYNFYGQLGNSSDTDSPVPVRVQGLSAGVQSISVGGDHTCAIVNGRVYCWGYNYKGQLGYDTGSTTCSGSFPCSSVPAPVQGLSTSAQAVAVGGYGHTCALLAGAVKCWGDNEYGQLGDGTGKDSLTPVQVSGLTSGVTSIIAGSEHACALMNGELWCWGANYAGQIGDGTDNGQHRYTPVRVIGLTSGLQAIGAGWSHNCAVVSGGVLCWGDNLYGELGNIVTTNPSDIPTPVQVYGLTAGAQAVGGGTSHSCAIVNGGVKCWGSNATGQFGNNSTIADSYDVVAGAYVTVDVKFPW